MRVDGGELGRVGLAGGAAAIAYLIEMALDMRLLRYPQNDLVLQGRLAPVPRRFWLPAGLVLHTGFGLTLALVYALVARRRLPGPPWLRGVLFANLENALLWPLTPLLDRYHPAVRDGQMPPLNTPVCFAQAVLRHVAYGAVLAVAYEALAGDRAAGPREGPAAAVPSHKDRDP